MMTMYLPGAGGIFISHRRADATYPTGWLFDRLASHFGSNRVFKDIDSILPGEDFAAAIGAALESCAVLLVVIGPQWLNAAGPTGRRLDDPGDFVRLEIEAALERQVRIIPVLVDGATMPEASQLPPSLAKLARRQAVPLSPDRFASDADRLIRALDAILSGTAADLPAQADGPPVTADVHASDGAGRRATRHQGKKSVLILTAAIVLASAGGLAAWAVLHTPARGTSAHRAQSGPEATALASSAYVPQSVAFSPNGKIMAVASLIGDNGPGRTYLWNPATHTVAAILRGPGSSSGVNVVGFSPDGQILATGDGNDSTYLWNPATRRVIATLANPGGQGIESVAFDPADRTMAAGDYDGITYLWNLVTRKITATLNDSGPNSHVDSVAFSPDGGILAVGDNNGKTYLWNLATHKIVATLTDPGRGHDVGSIAIGSDGTTLVAGDNDGSTYLWNLTTRSITATFTDPGGNGVDAIAINPKSPILAAGDIDGSTYLWSLITRRLIATLADPRQQGVNTVAFSPSGTTLATGDNNGNTYLWNLAISKRNRSRS